MTSLKRSGTGTGLYFPTTTSMAMAADGKNVVAFAAKAGTPLDVTLAQVQALLDASDVTEQPPFVAMARLGVMLMTQKELP